MPLQGREEHESLREPESQIEELSWTYEGSSQHRDCVAAMNQPIQECGCHLLILECVIMPLSFIVLLVEAILEAVLCLHLLNIPSRACLWLAGIR